MKEKKEIFDPDIFLSLHLGEGAIFFILARAVIYDDDDSIERLS